MNIEPNIEWTCHICKETRPDAKISVHTKPLIVNGKRVGDMNIRYCNDKESCIYTVTDFSFMKGEKIEPR